MQQTNVIEPVFIFDEDNNYRFHDRQKSFDIGWHIGRKVKNVIGFIVIFSHLITRRRKERQQDLMAGVSFFQSFDHRTPLFKFTQ